MNESRKEKAQGEEGGVEVLMDRVENRHDMEEGRNKRWKGG